jgi:UDP-glucose:glycoprotein glucosyltransferase
MSQSLPTNHALRPSGIHFRESIANEDPALYFPMLTALSTECPTLTHQTPEQQLDSILELIRETPELLQGHPKWDLSSFQASIAMHATTPKIQAYYQYYDTAINQTDAGSTTGQLCESWVEWRGKGFCDVEELRKDIELTLTGEHSL